MIHRIPPTQEQGDRLLSLALALTAIINGYVVSTLQRNVPIEKEVKK